MPEYAVTLDWRAGGNNSAAGSPLSIFPSWRSWMAVWVIGVMRDKLRNLNADRNGTTQIHQVPN